MKPLIQKLALNAETSFVAKTFRTPYFEVSWHQHVEYELILFTEGSGICFIGNYVGEFKTGDIFFIGSDVPHTFQKQQKEMFAAAVVIQFREDFWGADFLNIPENNSITELFALSMAGLQIKGKGNYLLEAQIKSLEFATGFSRISTLCNCLQLILDERHTLPLSTRQIKVSNEKSKERIDCIFHYTINNFQQPISLPQIAKLANMSVAAFCIYFKKCTQKSYIEFLNEIRIGYACTLLQNTEKRVIEICYESGFNTAVNFNKQFLKIKKMQPRQFKNQFNNVGLL